jgi:hypothetical protein
VDKVWDMVFFLYLCFSISSLALGLFDDFEGRAIDSADPAHKRTTEGFKAVSPAGPNSVLIMCALSVSSVPHFCS